MANPAATFMLGISERSLKAQPLAEFLGVPALAPHGEATGDKHFEINLGEGAAARVLDAVWSPLSLRGMIGLGRPLVMRDITDRKRAEEVLRESEFRYRSLFDNAHDLVFSLDREGRFLSANDAMAKATGYAPEKFLELTIADLMNEAEYEHLTRDFLPSLAEEEHAMVETELISKDGDTIMLEASVHLIRENGEPAGIQCISRDVTEQRLWEEALRHQALHDGVTSLPNRAFFRERLRQVAADHADGASHAVLILDLDGFKEINDTFGHHCGDALLRQVGYRLERTMRTADIVARLGGDEFALIIPVTDTAQGCRAALRVLDALLPTYEVEGQTLRLSASVGVAICPARWQRRGHSAPTRRHRHVHGEAGRRSEVCHLLRAGRSVHHRQDRDQLASCGLRSRGMSSLSATNRRSDAQADRCTGSRRWPAGSTPTED